MTAANIAESISDILFVAEETNVFAILDGASVPNLLDKLYELEPEYCCLYRGELEPDMAETAPYLIWMRRNSEFTRWILEDGWGKHWGIFAATDADLRTLRQHFRKFLMVHDEDGKPLYFRYYDPRVLRVYLPTCNEREIEIVFGPIQRYCVEGETPGSLIEFSHKEFNLTQRDSPLEAAQPSG